VLLEPGGEPFAYKGVHQAVNLAVPELGLRLALELRRPELHRDDRREAIANILAREVGVLLLQEPLVSPILVDDPGQGGAEARHMGPALHGVDQVGKGEGRLLIGVVVLDDHLDIDIVTAADEVDGTMQGRLGRVERLDVIDDAALVLVDLFLTRALVPHCEAGPARQVRKLSAPPREILELELHGLEYQGIGLETRRGARSLDLLALRDLGDGLAPLVPLGVPVTVAANLHLEPLGESVCARDAHTMQAAGDLIGAFAELAASMQHRVHDLERWALLLCMHVNRDASSVIYNGNGAVSMYYYFDGIAEPGESLVDGVIDDLEDDVVEPSV